MKKNIIKVAFVAAIAMVSGINVFNAKGSDVVSNVMLSDVEALADGESGCVNGPNCWGYCFVNGGIYSCEDYWIWNCITAIN